LVLRIHVQDADRRPANGCLAAQIDALPFEVIFPPIVSRMKQLRYFVRHRINARQVRALVKIAVDAGQRQIVLVVTAAVNSRNDVLDVKGG